VGLKTRDAFLAELGAGVWAVEWGDEQDLVRAAEVHRRYRALAGGLVDGVVISVAERLGAAAIATLDLRHFGAVAIGGKPKLLPRDL
ncbi:MAG: PIN domain-containing protein, partial [Gemmatimonadales bacterium]